MTRDLHDHYFKEAKREGYRSRAAYKLTEIDDRRKILARGDVVLDCGAAPGSWLQIAAERVGPKGRVVGVDLKRIDPLQKHANVVLIEGDLTAMPAADLLAATAIGGRPAAKRFDVVLSDMAPDTTGDATIDHHGSIRLCQAVLDRCPDLLARGGNLVMKVFEGEVYPELLERARESFETVKGFKPKASRSISREMFAVCRGFTGADTRAEETPVAKKRPKPGAGWGK